MGLSDRMLRRSLQNFIPEGSAVVASEAGASDVLGKRRRMTALLTTDALLLATPVRARTILTTIPRADIRSVEPVEPAVVTLTFDDYARAIRRVVHLDLSRHGDRERIIEQLRGARPDA